MSVAGLRVAPTKGFLLNFKRRVKFIEEGYELLSMKRDELSKLLKDYLEDLKAAREEVGREMEDVMVKFRSIYALLGSDAIDSYAAAVPKDLELTVLPKSVMGVIVPYIKITQTVDVRDKFGPVIRHAANEIYTVLKQLLKLTDVESRIEIIADELERTNRMVNALEKVVIPNMKKTIKYIEDLLDEDMLEEFTRLKIVRRLLYERRGE